MALVSIPFLVAAAFSVGGQLLTDRYRCDGPEIDLRKGSGSAAGIPHLDQGETNLCAPYTAAEMIDAWRISNLGRPLRVEERTSPIALAVEFAASNDFPYSFPIQNSTDPLSREGGRWGGLVCVHVKSAREIGVCSDRVLQETQGKSLEAIAKTEALFDALRDYQALDPKMREEKRRRFAERIRTVLASLPPSLEGAALPSHSEITEELRFFTGDDPYVPMSRLLLAPCRQSRTALPDLPECRTQIDAGLDAFGWSMRTVPFREPTTFQQINRLLTLEKSLPVAIAYCHKVVGRGRGYRPNSILHDACSQHWSLVIGRRERAGKCEFLVRDTDGGRPDKVSTDWQVDQGDVWVDAEVLMRATYALQWLHPANADD